MTDGRNPNYEVLSLIGYGLAKFDNVFHREFGCASKQAFFRTLVARGIAKTEDVVKSYQDIFDPFFPNKRPGWWDRQAYYRHRKIYIDFLFGHLDVAGYAEAVKPHIVGEGEAGEGVPQVAPLVKSQFQSMLMTGLEAEFYFMAHYERVARFAGGELADARMLGDGYDFQIRCRGRYFLAEVKGVKRKAGRIRLTEKEYCQAKAYGDSYGIVVVSNLAGQPWLTPIFNPTAERAARKLGLRAHARAQPVTEYLSASLAWQSWK